MVRLSRRKIAHFVVDRLLAGNDKNKLLGEVAAYLVTTGRTRELELLVRDIEDVLAQRGIVVADVTSAHPLTKALKNEVKAFVGASSLQLRETVDPSVLGGVRIDLPGRRFDGTIARKLAALKAKQV